MKKAISVLLALVFVLSLSITAFADSSKLSYVVLGDSIGVGSGIVNSGEACYGKIVANTNGYIYSNYAVDGATTSDLLRRINEERVAGAIKSADIINISIGGNNFIKSNLFWLLMTIPFGNMNKVNQIIDGIKNDLEQIIPAIKKMNPDAVILLQTLYNPWKGKALEGIYQKGVDALNSCYREYLADNPGAYELVDVCSAFASQSNDLIAIDTIHPNAEGNKLIAKVVLRKLYDLGLGTKTEPVILAEPIDRIPSDMSEIVRMIMYYVNLFI